MDSNIEIFDKDGNALDVADVIGAFLHEQIDTIDEMYDVEDITIGIENYFDDDGRQKLCIYNPEYVILDITYVNVNIDTSE